MIKKIVFTLFLLLIVITAGCLSDSTAQSSSDVSPSGGVDTNPAVVGEDEEETRPISSQWYSISKERERAGGEIFQYNGIGIMISVDPSEFKYYGSTSVRMPSAEDREKIQNSEQSIIIKMKFRIKETGEIFETRVTAYGSSFMFDSMPGWPATLKERGKNLQSSDIEWQPEFGLRNKYND